MTGTTETLTRPDGKESFNMDEIDLAHLAGLVDGTATFTLQIEKDESYAIDYRATPILRISRPKIDEVTLGKLDAYSEGEGVRYTFDEREASIIFQVSAPDSIERFLKPLVPYLVSKQDEARIMIDEVIPLIEAGALQDRELFVELVGWVEELRRTTRKGFDSKYDQQYFADEWGLEA